MNRNNKIAKAVFTSKLRTEYEDQHFIGTFVNLEIHFKGSFKLMTCNREWSPQQALACIAQEFKVPSEE